MIGINSAEECHEIVQEINTAKTQEIIVVAILTADNCHLVRMERKKPKRAAMSAKIRKAPEKISLNIMKLLCYLQMKLFVNLLYCVLYACIIYLIGEKVKSASLSMC